MARRAELHTTWVKDIHTGLAMMRKRICVAAFVGVD